MNNEVFDLPENQVTFTVLVKGAYWIESGETSYGGYNEAGAKEVAADVKRHHSGVQTCIVKATTSYEYTVNV